MTGIPSTRSEFFGRDSFVPFIGRIEDVNDPKHAGRVKVRCIGWHPKKKKGGTDTEDALSTDDLPWARVTLPTTMPQQGRIGGKHGLLNGCWVFGFFLDGDEAQDPMIISSINFTPKSTDSDDRNNLKGQDGKDDEEDDAFSLNIVSPKTSPGNAALHTKAEQDKGFGDKTDPSGHGWSADYDATKCGGTKPLRSRAAEERQETNNTKETPTAQNTDLMQGDGRCGATQHARDDIKKLVKEHMPSQLSRYNFNDSVWNNYTGKFINLNGALAQLAIAICNVLKAPINSKKANDNDKHRKDKAKATVAVPDRDGTIRDVIEDKLSLFSDSFNATVQVSAIDPLCDILMKILQALNDGGEDSDGDSPGGGGSPITPIMNPGASCIADTILINIEDIIDTIFEIAVEIATDAMDDYDIMQNEFAATGIGFLAGVTSVMRFPLTDMYAFAKPAFNKMGNKSQDKDNKKDGCRPDRIYNTEIGSLGSIAGFSSDSGGSGTGGSDQGGGQGSHSDVRLPTIGFGGLDTTIELIPTHILCDDAYTPVIKDPGFPNDDEDNEGGVGIGDDETLCKDNSNCPNGFVCVDGRCISGENLIDGGGGLTDLACEGSDDCPAGFTCVDGFCMLTEGLVWPDDVPFAGIGGEAYIPGAGNDFWEPGEFQGIGADGYVPNSVRTIPAGSGGVAVAVSLPSSELRAAKNFVNGTPNTVVILRKGQRYFFNNRRDDTKVYPSIYIKGYQAQPIPVVERKSGELVAILTAAAAFDPNAPTTNISLIPDESTKGITTDDPAYQITLGGFHIANTGFKYTNPEIRIFDKDKGIYNNAEAKVIISDGRIVDYDIINNGTEFRRIPEIEIIDETGYGAKLYPIMNVKERNQEQLLPEPIQRIYCPNNQKNLL